MPCALKEWDTNKDGDIDLDEFSSMAYPAVEKEDLPLAFQATDTDGITLTGYIEPFVCNVLLKKVKYLIIMQCLLSSIMTIILLGFPILLLDSQLGLININQ